MTYGLAHGPCRALFFLGGLKLADVVWQHWELTGPLSLGSPSLSWLWLSLLAAWDVEGRLAF